MNHLQKLLRLELGLIGVLLLGSVFGPDFMNIKVGPIPVTLDRILWGAVVVFFAIQFFSRRLPFYRISFSDFVFGAFLGYIALNVATTNWSYNKLQPVAGWLFFYIVPAGMYFVARNLPHREALAKWFTMAMAGLGLYLALTAFFEVANLHALIFPRFIVNSPMQEFLGRGRGPFLNPIANGIVQTLCMCCVLVWWRQLPYRFKLWSIVYCGILLLGILCTLTRSVWLSAGIVVMGFVWVYSPKPLKAVMVMIVPVSAFLFFSVGKEKLNSFKRDKNVTAEEMSQSIQLRPLLAVIASRMIADKPFFGHGFRQYQKTKLSYHDRDNSNLPIQKVRPFVQHNVFLAYGVDIGLIGLTLYISLLGIWVWSSVAILLADQVPLYAKQASAVFLALLVCVVVNGVFHDVAVIPMLNHYVFCMAGWVVGLRQYFLVQKEVTYQVVNPPKELEEGESSLPEKRINEVTSVEKKIDRHLAAVDQYIQEEVNASADPIHEQPAVEQAAEDATTKMTTKKKFKPIRAAVSQQVVMKSLSGEVRIVPEPRSENQSAETWDLSFDALELCVKKDEQESQKAEQIPATSSTQIEPTEVKDQSSVPLYEMPPEQVPVAVTSSFNLSEFPWPKDSPR